MFLKRALVLVVVLSLTGSALAAPLDIGTTVAVANTVTLESGTIKQPLLKGTVVHQDEIIVTGIDAKAEVELLDQTKLAVGSEARLVLDKFVYDPNASSASISLKVSKGAFRFLTGLAPKDSYEIRTPVAFVGTRGTVFDLYVGGGGETAVLLLQGAVEVCTLAGSCRLQDKIGSILIVGVDGVISLYSDCKSSFIKQIGFQTAFPFIGKRLLIDPIQRMTPADFECVSPRRPPIIRAQGEGRSSLPPAGTTGLTSPEVLAWAGWPGPYIGLNGGGVLSSGNSNLTVIAEDPKFHPTGGFGGGQIGYNWQRDRIVYGIEADIQGADVSGSAADSDPSFPWTASAHTSLDWFGTVRGRLGYTFGEALVYGTGGFALGGVEDKVSLNCCFPPLPGQQASAKSGKTVTGYAVGGGLEYALTPRLSGKVEYLHMDLGSDTLVANDSGGIVIATVKIDHTYEIVRAGINYHFGRSYEPLK